MPWATNATALLLLLLGSPASAQWQPRGITPTETSLADVLAAEATASGGNAARTAPRRERWTYSAGTRRIAVAVAVRGNDFRTSLDLDGLTYTAGRTGGQHWRADGNGIAHGVDADLQGDPLDRAPQALFGIDTAACTLTGEAHLPAAAWVVETHPAHDKSAFLYIDEATGSIVREIVRDGRQVDTTTFSDFASRDGVRRAGRWHVTGAARGDTLDVTLDALEPGDVAAAEIAQPVPRFFAPAVPLTQSVDLPATFTRRGTSLSIDVAVRVDGKPERFILDSGTTSVTVDPRVATRWGETPLGHAVLPSLSVGALQLDRVSVLSVPLFNGDAGILGLDFFVGHVVDVDYLHGRVRVLSSDDARAAFADPRTAIVPANVAEGLPLVPAAFGPAHGDTFLIDTGSPRLYVMRPFVRRFADEIKAHWTEDGSPYPTTYLEGSIAVQPFRADGFTFAGARAGTLVVGAQVPSDLTDDLDIPFDGIIGTDILRQFDILFDYDNNRLGVRQ